MCYDYHGKWDKKTGHNAPLGPRPDEAGADLTLNLEYTVRYLLQVGVTCHVSRVMSRAAAARRRAREDCAGGAAVRPSLPPQEQQQRQDGGAGTG